MSKVSYYLRSIVTLLTGLSRPWRTIGIFIGFPGSVPAEIILRRSGWRFKIRSPLDAWIVKETCIDSAYWPVGAFETGWSVVDIGAGIGEFTVMAASSCPDGVIHAYEPQLASYELLEHNLTLNRLERVKTFREAAGKVGQHLEAAISGEQAPSTRFVNGGGSKAIPAVDLQKILDRLPGGDCDLLKVDCEGCEFELLLGADPSALRKVKRMVLEAHEGYFEHTTEELVCHLEKNGFSVKRDPNPVHAYLSLLFATR